MSSNMDREDGIAVVGASALFPGSIDGASFWRNILEGRDFMTDVPADHWLIDDYYDADPSKPGKVYAKRGAFLPKIDFDPMLHGIPPMQLSTTDTAQLLALIVANKVLDDAASVQFGKVSRKDISVILGIASATELVGQMVAKIQRPHWAKALRDAQLPESQVQDICNRIEATYPTWDESTFPGLLGNVVAGRIANRLDLGGTNCVVDAACASSLGAVAMAVQELRSGNSDLVITGGADALNDIFMYMCFSKTPALSPSGDCRPFSENADGTMLGEGIGMVALRRLADAQRDGDKIYAVIRGMGSSSDGRAKSIYAPRAEGQELAIRRAYERAGYGAHEVELIEAHGTGTKAGDAAEFSGLRRAFQNAPRTDRQWCALGSVKSQIGHTKAAAGSASLFKIVMALHHKVLPPTIKVDKPNTKMEIANSPFYLNTATRPWIHTPHTTRKGSVSAFGFGGSNFHVTLEEYVGGKSTAQRFSNLPVQMLLLHGADADALLAKAREYQGRLASGALPLLARESQLAFDATGSARLAVLSADAQTAMVDLATAISAITKDKSRAFSMSGRMHYGLGTDVPPMAFLFPGQGSQYVNMGADLAVEYEAVRQLWDATAAMDLDSEHKLHQVVFPIPVFSDAERAAQTELLTRTHWAQPAIGATSLSMLHLLRELGVHATAAAGHSYGEVTALYAAGAITTPASMLMISRKRGELMHAAASTPGSMTAVFASEQQVQKLMAEHATVGVTIANINSPSQVVIAGKTPAIELCEGMLKAAKVSFRRLPVATAFHTELVAGSAEPFEAFLSTTPIVAPGMRIYANTTAKPYPTEPDAIRTTLAWQLANPVRFEELVGRMYDDGYRIFLEVGPGSVLTGMVADCLQNKPHVAVSLDNRKADGRAAFFNALGVLSANGVVIDYAKLWQEFVPFAAAQDAPKLSPATVKLSGANYGKPYPPTEGTVAVPKPNPERPAIVAVPQPVAVAAPRERTESVPATVQQFAVPQVPPAATEMARPSMDANWLAAFQTMQQQTLESQKAFAQTLSDTHLAFLRTSETAFAQLGQLAGASSGIVPGVMPVHAVPIARAAVQAPAQPVPPPAQPLPVVASVVRAQMPTAPATRTVAVPTIPAQSIDFEGMLMAVVADKTGYPIEMLTLDMELESGLGIDSIKRVEILSVLQEKIPALADVDPGQLAALNTLGEIVAFAAQASPAVPAVRAVTAAATATANAPQSLDFEGMLLAVVADKTGYPIEMLTLDMELESGLGIDSIKRVEILSVLQEKIPALADVDPGQLAALNTLGEIVAFAAKTSPAVPAARAVTATATATANAPQSLDFEGMLLAVVADKTGYPIEMLTLDMELESGLGIDSIKRVEILSVLQEKIPALADVDPGQLAALNTLGEIVAFAAGTSTGTVAPAASTAKPAATSDVHLRRLAVEISDTPASGFATPGLRSADPLYLVADNRGVAPLLATKLALAGIRTSVVATVPADARAVMILAGIDRAPDSPEAQLGKNEAVFRQLQVCAQTMATHGILLVTVQDTGGDFGLGGAVGNRAWSAGIVAAAKTAALEWPAVSVKAIDIETADHEPAAIAAALCRELIAGGAQLEVGLKADGRRVSVTVREETQIQSVVAPFTKDDVIVVSGGARGVTAACMEQLLTRVPAKVAILGRTLLEDEPAGLAGLRTDTELKKALLQQYTRAGTTISPQKLGSEVRAILAQRELKGNLAKFAALGATVKYFCVDVSDASSVQSAIATIRTTLGPIRGLVHAAGVLADKEIRLKTLEQYRSVVSTKLDGFRYLLDATQSDALTQIVCFSSIAARRGNTGQIDYAMANEVLNRVCRHEQVRRGNTCLVKAIGWGPWAGGMVDPGLEKHFAAMGVALIPLDQGAKLFADEYMGRNGDSCEIVFGGGLDKFGGATQAKSTTSVSHLWIHASTHPYMASHVIRDVPVVPVVVANQIGLQAVRELYPNVRCTQTHKLQVVKGMQLSDFSTVGNWYVVACHTDPDNACVNVRISDDANGVYYTLKVDITSQGQPLVPAALSAAAKPMQVWDLKADAIYATRLFHGPDFQVIVSVLGISDDGCVANLATRRPVMPGAVLNFDVLDGGLQLALLWVQERMGGQSLPTGFDTCTFYEGVAYDGAVRCELRCEARSTLMAQWTLGYRNTRGELLAALEGLKVHLLADAAPGLQMTHAMSPAGVA